MLSMVKKNYAIFLYIIATISLTIVIATYVYLLGIATETIIMDNLNKNKDLEECQEYNNIITEMCHG